MNSDLLLNGASPHLPDQGWYACEQKNQNLTFAENF
jgi:hypothetical protein